MKLMSFWCPRTGISGHFLTDMEPLEFLKYCWLNQSDSAQLTGNLEIGVQDARQWEADGRSTVYRQKIKLQELK